jgi:hypothetical protein
MFRRIFILLSSVSLTLGGLLAAQADFTAPGAVKSLTDPGVSEFLMKLRFCSLKRAMVACLGNASGIQ